MMKSFFGLSRRGTDEKEKESNEDDEVMANDVVGHALGNGSACTIPSIAGGSKADEGKSTDSVSLPRGSASLADRQHYHPEQVLDSDEGRADDGDDGDDGDDDYKDVGQESESDEVIDAEFDENGDQEISQATGKRIKSKSVMKDDDSQSDVVDDESSGEDDEDFPSADDELKGKSTGSSRKVNDSKDQPFVGRRVRVIRGIGEGTEGRVIAVRSKGWWALDTLKKSVRSRQCEFVDNGIDDESGVKGLNFSQKHKKLRGTINFSERDSNRSSSDVQVNLDRLPLQQETTPLYMSDILDNAAKPLSEKIYCDHGEMLVAHPRPGVLPPIVLNGAGIPSGLEHLDPGHELQIFDRKCGIILEASVRADALPALLREHAEYEPIVPAKYQTETVSSVREGRSGPDLLVSAEVRPQTKRRLEGKKVIITSGLYKGIEGRIQASIPGGWYLVEGLQNGISVVASPEFVKEIQDTPAASIVNDENSSQSKEKSGPDTKSQLRTMRSTFKNALNETLQSESNLATVQRYSLTEDRRNLEQQLRENFEDELVTKRLKKRLDYVKSCLKKAERDSQVIHAAYRTTHAAVDRVLNGEFADGIE